MKHLIFKATTFFMIIIYIISLLSVYTYAEDTADSNFAEVYLTSTYPRAKGLSAIRAANFGTPKTDTKADTKCWVMQPDATRNYSFINFKLTSNMKSSSFNGTSYVVEVDYYSEESGFLKLCYKDVYNNYNYGDVLYTEGDNEWKTAYFYMNDADFANKINDEYDFCLSTIIQYNDSQYAVSPGAVWISHIKVIKQDCSLPIYMKYSTNKAGNCYKWFENDKILNVSLTNYLSKNTSAKVTHRIISETEKPQKTVFEQIDYMDFLEGETKNFELNFGSVQKCGIYRYEVQITADGGTVNTSQSNCKLAVVKTDEKGIKNNDVMINFHGDRYDDDAKAMGVEMINLANIGGARLPISLLSTYNSGTDTYSLENNINVKNIFDLYKANNLEVLALLMNGGKNHVMPETDDEITEYRKAVREIASEMQTDVSMYEIWNEPNLLAFNAKFKKPELYAGTVKAAYEEIKNIKPSSKVGIFSLAFVGLNTSNDPDYYVAGDPYFNTAMQSGAWKYADALAIHPYIGGNPDTSLYIPNTVNKYRSAFAQNGVENIDVWSTELGYSTIELNTFGEYTKEQLQGIYNCRSALLYKQLGISQKLMFYNLEKKGITPIDREDNFGMVEPGYERAKLYNTYFFPTESYLMLAAHNYVMADSIADKFVYDNNNVRVMQYKSNKFGKNIVAAYTTNGTSKNITANLGANSITVYDAYGNETMLSSDTGIYSIEISDAPVYIITSDNDSSVTAVEDIHPISVKAYGEYINNCFPYNTAPQFNIEFKENQGVNLQGVGVYYTLLDGETGNTILGKYSKRINVAANDTQSIDICIPNLSLGRYRLSIKVSADNYNETKVIPFSISSSVQRKQEKSGLYLLNNGIGIKNDLNLIGINYSVSIVAKYNDDLAYEDLKLYNAVYDGNILTGVTTKSSNSGGNGYAVWNNIILPENSNVYDSRKIMIWNNMKCMFDVLTLYK